MNQAHGLKSGDVRFLLFFGDDDFKVPLVMTLRFQGYQTYRKGKLLPVFRNAAPDHDDLHQFTEEKKGSLVIDLDTLIADLQACRDGVAGKPR